MSLKYMINNLRIQTFEMQEYVATATTRSCVEWFGTKAIKMPEKARGIISDSFVSSEPGCDRTRLRSSNNGMTPEFHSTSKGCSQRVR